MTTKGFFSLRYSLGGRRRGRTSKFDFISSQLGLFTPAVVQRDWRPSIFLLRREIFGEVKLSRGRGPRVSVPRGCRPLSEVSFPPIHLASGDPVRSVPSLSQLSPESRASLCVCELHPKTET